MNRSAVTQKYSEKFTATIHEVPKIKEFVEKTLKDWFVQEEDLQDIVLASDEAATNIVMHAYNGENKQENTLKIMIKKKGNLIEIDMEDTGLTFDIRTLPKPDIQLNLKGQKRGGFGVFLMKTLMDKINYKRKKDCNVTVLLKKINDG